MIDINIRLDSTDINKIICYNSENVENVLQKFNVSSNTINIIKRLGIETAADFKAVSLNRIEFYDLLEDNFNGEYTISDVVAKNLFEIMKAIGSKMDLRRTLASFKN